MVLRASALLLAALLGAGCAPSLSPLFRDYAVTTADAPVPERVRAALAEAGWDAHEGRSPSVVATAPRTVSEWGLYRVEVSLEVTPVGSRHVRVLVHPYRRFVTGGRSKIPFLTTSLRQAVLPDLNAAFAAQGLALVTATR